MLPCTIASFSVVVPCIRLSEANFGRSGRETTIAKRPLLSNIAMPLGFGPNGRSLWPSEVVLTSDSRVQLPTSSLAVRATALEIAIPRHATAVRIAVVKHLMSFLARRIVLTSIGRLDYQWQYRRLPLRVKPGSEREQPQSALKQSSDMPHR